MPVVGRAVASGAGRGRTLLGVTTGIPVTGARGEEPGTFVGAVGVGAVGVGAVGRLAVLVPVKAFGEAKRRLDPAVSPADRRLLARRMADRVVTAAAPLPVAVVCDDVEVADWARGRGALVIWEPGRGLNGAVEQGVDHLAAMGAEQVTVAHADLPLAAGLGDLPPFDGVTLVPDRHRDGTNVLRVPVRSGFRFSYGPGSFQRHCEQCQRLGMAAKVLDLPELAWDVDLPGDLQWR